MKVWNRNPSIALALAIALYCTFAYIYALIKPIWCDEVWAMIPASNLAFHGFLGMGDQTTLILPTLHSERHMYWFPPLSYWSMAAWFRVFGYGLMQARWHSIAWGCVLLMGVWYIGARTNHLSRTSHVARQTYPAFIWTGIWAALICAVDFTFLMHSDGRPDIMCAALGIWGLALGSEWLIAAACLTHPYGILYAIALAVTKRKIYWLPYLVAGLIWVPYIAQEPTAFISQMILGQFVVHIFPFIPGNEFSPGLWAGQAVWQAFGFGWRLVVLAVYVGCSALVALRNKEIAWYLGLIAILALLTVQSPYYLAAHAIPLMALCVAIQMRRWPWLAGILFFECAFAVTSLFPLWGWDGIFDLR